ncbi:MAG: type II toxin-antitoxin system VapC family toxin [Nakamurella sp.]
MRDTVGTLVDSNVLLDVATADPIWSSWSETRLAAAVRRGPVCINPLIYAEISVGFDRIEDLDDALPPHVFIRAELPYQAGFLAGHAFSAYRRRGGARRSPLPDFYIGAHAAVAGLQLLTRDATRYRTYFPTVTLIAP